jgi:hypothetical protein
MEIKARLRVKCGCCGAIYLVAVFGAPKIRVMRSWCQFCGSRVVPLREDNVKTIDTFLNPVGE